MMTILLIWCLIGIMNAISFCRLVLEDMNSRDIGNLLILAFFAMMITILGPITIVFLLIDSIKE